MKGISRCQMNQLMTIPEVQQIIEAKFVELRLIFKNKLKQGPQQEQNPEEPKASNIIKFPRSHQKNFDENPSTRSSAANHNDETNTTDSDSSGAAIIKIVDASGYRYTPEEEQIKIFMDYFNNHRLLRRAILDEFFLRILPYSNIMVK
jgi:hypothetical protein